MILGVKSPAKAPGTSNQRAGSVAELQATSSPQNSPNTDPLHRGSFTNLPGAPQTIKNLFFPSKKKEKNMVFVCEELYFFHGLEGHWFAISEESPNLWAVGFIPRLLRPLQNRDRKGQKHRKPNIKVWWVPYIPRIPSMPCRICLKNISCVITVT